MISAGRLKPIGTSSPNTPLIRALFVTSVCKRCGKLLPAVEIIEEYPEDKYWLSYLIYGTTAEGRPLHVQCSHPSRLLVKVVTLYEPDPARWIDFRERRSS
jgi:hypothetical protein